MAKMVTETQAHAAAGPSFLGLPPEVRNMIYRQLLVGKKPLGTDARKKRVYDYYDAWRHKIYPGWASFGKYQLHPAILRVCSQLYREANPILNGENTLGIYINGSKDKYRAEEEEEKEITDDFDSEDETEANTSFMNNQSVVEDWTQKYCAVIRKFQILEIVIEDADLLAVRTEVRNLCCQILREMPALRHLSLHLKNDTDQWYDIALAPFGMLRNMRSVVIHGVPLSLAERLNGLMLGNSPQNDVQEMYRLLKQFVRDYNGNHSYLSEASTARDEWDVQEFKKIRSRILSDCQRRMDRDAFLMLNSDAKQ